MTPPFKFDPTRIPGSMPTYPTKGGYQPASVGAGGEMRAPEKPQGAPVIFPWWLYEMPGSTDWEQNAVNFTAAGGVTTAVPGVSYRPQQGNVAVLKQLILTVQNSLATINLRVKLLIDGSPVAGWGNMVFPPVAATGVILPFNDMIVRMAENSTLTAAFVDVGGAGYTCSFQARGWEVAKTTVDAFSQGVPY